MTVDRMSKQMKPPNTFGWRKVGILPDGKAIVGGLDG
jgi:hypothetical protein